MTGLRSACLLLLLAGISNSAMLKRTSTSLTPGLDASIILLQQEGNATTTREVTVINVAGEETSASTNTTETTSSSSNSTSGDVIVVSEDNPLFLDPEDYDDWLEEA
jgi:hypothetical protein